MRKLLGVALALGITGVTVTESAVALDLTLEQFYMQEIGKLVDFGNFPLANTDCATDELRHAFVEDNFSSTVRQWLDMFLAERARYTDDLNVNPIDYYAMSYHHYYDFYCTVDGGQPAIPVEEVAADMAEIARLNFVLGMSLLEKQ